jgi:hypothetical protein
MKDYDISSDNIFKDLGLKDADKLKEKTIRKINSKQSCLIDSLEEQFDLQEFLIDQSDLFIYCEIRKGYEEEMKEEKK